MQGDDAEAAQRCSPPAPRKAADVAIFTPVARFPGGDPCRISSSRPNPSQSGRRRPKGVGTRRGGGLEHCWWRPRGRVRGRRTAPLGAADRACCLARRAVAATMVVHDRGGRGRGGLMPCSRPSSLGAPSSACLVLLAAARSWRVCGIKGRDWNRDTSYHDRNGSDCARGVAGSDDERQVGHGPLLGVRGTPFRRAGQRVRGGGVHGR